MSRPATREPGQSASETESRDERIQKRRERVKARMEIKKKMSKRTEEVKSK